MGAVALLIFISFASHADQHSDQFKKLAAKMGVKESDLGIAAGQVSKEGNNFVATINPEKKFIPASISKLFTTAAVLDTFPPGYKFKTQLLTAAPQEGKILKGDLILKGGGDPSFVSENMWFLVNAFLRNQISTIEGDLIVDDSFFDNLHIDPSRQPERVDRAYDAPTSALSFNWNSINIFVRPGAKSGEPAKVFIDPENDYVTVKGEVKTQKSGAGNNVNISRLEDKTGDVLRVSGGLGLDQHEITAYKNISEPELWAASNLKSFLLQRGISIKGKVKRGTTPASARVVSEYESKPIELIIADMNKFSNNYVAEMLTKAMGTTKQIPGSIKSGMQVINEYIKKVGIDLSQVELQNPSGLTRDNKFTAQSLFLLLENVRQDMSVYPELIHSLPIAGIDGTLKKRMKDGPATRWVRAKTGFLNGVVALAGYAGRRDGQVLSFVFIYNGRENEDKVRRLFDQMAEILVK